VGEEVVAVDLTTRYSVKTRGIICGQGGYRSLKKSFTRIYLFRVAWFVLTNENICICLNSRIQWIGNGYYQWHSILKNTWNSPLFWNFDNKSFVSNSVTSQILSSKFISRHRYHTCIYIRNTQLVNTPLRLQSFHSYLSDERRIRHRKIGGPVDRDQSSFFVVGFVFLHLSAGEDIAYFMLHICLSSEVRHNFSWK